MNKIRGYKGLNRHKKCYDCCLCAEEMNCEYDGDVSCCKKDIHFSEFPFDVFNDYPPSNSYYYEVYEVSNKGQHQKKVSRIHIGTEIGIDEFINNGIKFILNIARKNHSVVTQKDHRSTAINTKEGSAATNKGNFSIAANVGDISVATNTGSMSVAANIGCYSAVTNTGDYSAAINIGNNSAATNTGSQSAAINTGRNSVATNSGRVSIAANAGYYSSAINAGNFSIAANTGYCSDAINSGYCSVAICTSIGSTAKNNGEKSIAIATGLEGKAAAAIGNWIVLVERDVGFNILDVKAIKVDGERIKADTYYKLKNGEIIEAE